MAIWLGLVTHGITGLVNNEFLAILVIDDSTLLFKTCGLLGFINADILKGILVCHLVIAILYCSRYCCTKDIYKADMIQVYQCACYDVPLCFILLCSSLVPWDINVNTLT